jgi:hypothetical protein
MALPPAPGPLESRLEALSARINLELRAPLDAKLSASQRSLAANSARRRGDRHAADGDFFTAVKDAAPALVAASFSAPLRVLSQQPEGAGRARDAAQSGQKAEEPACETLTRRAAAALEIAQRGGDFAGFLRSVGKRVYNFWGMLVVELAALLLNVRAGKSAQLSA